MEGIIEQNTVSKPIEIKNLKRYLKKEDAICKLITGSGTGFFCKFTVNGRTMKGLFTNNHVLKEDLIKENSIIQLRHNDEIKEIKITLNRFKCTNEELDYTCIEIFDNEDYNNFFEIDDNINCQNPDVQYGNKLCVILQFPNNQDLSCGEGLIEGIKNANNTNIIIRGNNWCLYKTQVFFMIKGERINKEIEELRRPEDCDEFHIRSIE